MALKEIDNWALYKVEKKYGKMEMKIFKNSIEIFGKKFMGTHFNAL
jgi:hypothetical protein